MQRIRLGQPHVPVNACALVKPAIAEARVHADDQIILAAIIQKIAQVEAEGRIAVVVAADEISIQKHERVAKRAIELHADAPPGIFFPEYRMSRRYQPTLVSG